jgi:hypothetical protein
MSASVIGRLGSSTFRPSAAAVSMSLTGSCFSSESAPRPFHHGIRRRGGAIFWSALPSDERQVQADMRTHLIHRPARDIIPPPGWSSTFLLSRLILRGRHAATASRVQRNSVPSTQMLFDALHESASGPKRTSSATTPFLVVAIAPYTS